MPAILSGVATFIFYMKVKLFFFLFIIGCCSTLLSFKRLADHQSDYTAQPYKIQPSSSLEINGTTNINSFCCASKERFAESLAHFQFDPQEAIIYFEQTALPINISQLDCGGKAINRDLYKTLQADTYPFIHIQLVKVENLDCIPLQIGSQGVSFLATTHITIGCITNTVQIPIRITKKRNQQFQIIGGTALHFKDFELEPPTAMLGLIKVKEQLDIYLDLELALY